MVIFTPSKVRVISADRQYIDGVNRESHMGLVSRFIGSTRTEDQEKPSAHLDDLTDGALDTLGSVIRVMGNESFPLESDADAAVFPRLCTEFARHIENGAAVPSYDIETSTDGKREWENIRRFFADRRHAEKTFVTERLHGYRGVVDDLVSGLREIGMRDQTTESSVLECLTNIDDAVAAGELPQIKQVLSETVLKVSETFAEQRRDYENRLQELTESMSSLRQDLVAAREEMKRDSLTESFNRGAFDTAILQSLNLHFVLQQPVTLLMIDLDAFKNINDSFGHAAGDDVLRAVSDCLARSFIRKNDMIARYGGDEFAVILTDTSAKHAASLIDRFLDMVRGIHFSDFPDINVSCSVGYTEVMLDDTVKSVISRADLALYKAKSDGRDRSEYLPADTSIQATTH